MGAQECPTLCTSKSIMIIRFFSLWQTINCKIREKIISFPASWLKRNGNKLAALFKLLLKRQGEKIFRKSLYDSCPWTREAVIRPDVSGQRRLAARTLQKKRWRKSKKIRYKAGYKAYKNTVTNLPLLVIDVCALWNFFEYYAELSWRANASFLLTFAFPRILL